MIVRQSHQEKTGNKRGVRRFADHLQGRAHRFRCGGHGPADRSIRMAISDHHGGKDQRIMGLGVRNVLADALVLTQLEICLGKFGCQRRSCGILDCDAGTFCGTSCPQLRADQIGCPDQRDAGNACVHCCNGTGHDPWIVAFAQDDMGRLFCGTQAQGLQHAHSRPPILCPTGTRIRHRPEGSCHPC